MELERFKITVLPLREKLLNISQRLLDERADAEDVIQETFLKLWDVRHTLDDYRSVEALAVRVAKNLALDKIKMRKDTTGEAGLLIRHSEEQTPEEAAEMQDAVACIRHLIEQLPTLQQTIIRMKDIEGYELCEIADITGSPIENIRVNLSRARKKIREQFIALNQIRV